MEAVGRARSALPAAAPGVALLCVLAGAAVAVGRVLPLNALVVAVAVGVVVGNTVGTPNWAESGVGVHKLFLETGIVLLGAQLSVDEVAAGGPRVVALVVVTVAVAVVVVELLGRYVFDLRRRVTALLAAGASICGVSAVVAVAGAVDADGEDIATVTATVLLFDAVTLVAFPAAGSALGLAPKAFGVWAGLSMFSTGPVTAAGFAYDPVAGQWATLTKLTRNALVGVVAVGYSLAFVSREATSIRAVWTRFPKFLLGFAVVSVVASAGLLSPAAQSSLDALSTALFALAFVGLGLDVRLDRMRETGATPVLVVAASLCVVATLAFVAVTTLL
jgi:uncharacterized integral membrane protein (TIGR00698 family)